MIKKDVNCNGVALKQGRGRININYKTLYLLRVGEGFAALVQSQERGESIERKMIALT